MGFFDTPFVPADTTDRVDGKLKVTGTAKFAAEYSVPNLVYGSLLGSTIAKGSIQSINTRDAENAPGVRKVITHENVWRPPGYTDEKTAKQFGLQVLQTREIFSSGQPIALVIADKPEQAVYAASLIKVEYEKQTPQTDFAAALAPVKQLGEEWKAERVRGEADGWKKGEVSMQQEYHIPIEVHNPMEMHATIAVWEGDDKITLYDKNHSVKSVQGTIANALKLPQKNVNIIADYVGGGFGSGLRSWPHTMAAIIGAKMLNLPVKIVLTRPQMFTMVGYRPECWQRISLGAKKDGTITGIVHEAVTNTSTYEDFSENITGISRMLYQFPNVSTKYKKLPLNLGTPIWMRAPGEASGSFGLESALDELAWQLKMDPLELRKKNFADKEPEGKLPWSSNYLMECYEKGAAMFGWSKRKPAVRATRDGDWWIGMGVGVGTWNAWRSPATVRAVLESNGSILLQSATSDMGPGTATAMCNIAAKVMNMPLEKFRFELGRSSFPDSPGQGGSVTTASVGAAVNDACVELKKKIAALAAEVGGDAFSKAGFDTLNFAGGKITAGTVSVSYTELLQKKNLELLEVTQRSSPGEERRKYAFQSFAVHFAEVRVHALTGVVRVSRVVSVADAGSIVNEKTAASQIKGAVVGGIGMALMEDQEIDHRYGRHIGNDFAGYHVPVHADVPEIEVAFINKPDAYINPMGSKGLGEVGLIGSAAAIANAVYHATGKRITQLPITPDKILV
jgi:xanthine dehydrogenase YagR molybdenum-binding subunit